ncbi:MAG: indole-3-glycerol phosphate synthase TrpC [Vampirovibrionales bacterium]|nr:indole-3-glycerol phosphate synthase TrpC [Vampirovibrionales bacterium]
MPAPFESSNKAKLSQERSVLQQIAEAKRLEVATRIQNAPLASWKNQVQVLEEGLSLEAALRQSTQLPKLILEIKPASPSQGLMREQLNEELGDILKDYQRFGVGISVLCDAPFFGGSLALLENVQRQVNIPVLCKEFILDEYQVYEARKAGAAAVLLIVKMLPEQAQLQVLYHCILSLGMTPVVEIQNEAELERALALSAGVLLINHRDLDTLVLDMTTVERLSPKLPSDVLCIAASGISTAETIQKLLPVCDAFLIGSALMKLPLEQWERVLSQWHSAAETTKERRL